MSLLVGLSRSVRFTDSQPTQGVRPPVPPIRIPIPPILAARPRFPPTCRFTEAQWPTCSRHVACQEHQSTLSLCLSRSLSILYICIKYIMYNKLSREHEGDEYMCDCVYMCDRVCVCVIFGCSGLCGTVILCHDMELRNRES